MKVHAIMDELCKCIVSHRKTTKTIYLVSVASFYHNKTTSCLKEYQSKNSKHPLMASNYTYRVQFIYSGSSRVVEHFTVSHGKTIREAALCMTHVCFRWSFPEVRFPSLLSLNNHLL